MVAVTIAAYLDDERGRVDVALKQLQGRMTLGFPSHLREAVEYALATAGKRIRPILSMAAYAACRGTVPDEAVRLSCALELVHTYSLVHDDLPCMDDDDLRRGRATLHRAFGSRRAMLAGASLLPAAMEVLDSEGQAIGLDVAERAVLVGELAQAAGATGMVGGQLLDLQAEDRRVEPDELEWVHRRKTGALLTCSLRIGVRAGRGDDELLRALTSYGASLGLAFQITDDLLDVVGTSADLGKTAGRDVELRKASYPALFGVEGSRALARARVAEAKEALADHDLPRLIQIADYVIERTQ
ncbi:MAG: polyprenyl synthetase family protein [Gemmatimonas sp.]|nr:polyprenyl synthetase family protein [Gemmatimonas sp.]